MTLFLSFLFSTCTCFLLSDTAHWVLSGLIHAVTVVFHRHNVFKTVREYLNTWSLTDQHTPSNCPDKCPPSQFLSVHAHALLFLQLHLPILRHHCCHRLVLPTTYRPPPQKKNLPDLPAVLQHQIPHLIHIFKRCLPYSPSFNLEDSLLLIKSRTLNLHICTWVIRARRRASTGSVLVNVTPITKTSPPTKLSNVHLTVLRMSALSTNLNLTTNTLRT
jgi:hypothetical protein